MVKCLFISFKTDIGKKRSENQDRVYSEFLGDNVSIAIVCDGMGGASSGGVASQLAIDSMISRIKENYRAGMSENSIRNMMLTSVHYANNVVYENSKADIEKNGMGTTVVAALVVQKKIYVVSVGDSRAYLIRDNQMKQVTSDHSMVADMVRRGVLTEEQAACHPMRNYITRAVGTDDTIEVDILSIPRMNGDRWIVCSDGLYGQISKQELEETAKTAELEEAAGKLLVLALEHGGKDNISFIILDDMREPLRHHEEKDDEIYSTLEEEPEKEDNIIENAVPGNSDQEGVPAE